MTNLKPIKKLPRRVAGKTIGLYNQRKSTSKTKPRFYIDSPRRSMTQNKKETIISGWYIPARGHKVRAMRIKNNLKFYDLKYGNERPDVVLSNPDIDERVAVSSGFYKKIPFENGSLEIQINVGAGFQTIYQIDIKYSEELLFEMAYNPNMAENYAEHQVLLENRKQYFYEPELNQVYKRDPNDPRLVAFYLPQFHPIAQNDLAWGKGFTEWRNVSTASPRFVGHQQPILPRDLGFYDLRLDSVLKTQIDLAKRHGIYGFCFYYYWFSGEKILDIPLDTFLKHKNWDFNFLICWANENWTRRWDGRNNEIILAQKYTKDDPLNFIKDVEKILLDPRYIRENGKPVLAVYRIESLKDPERYAKVWREYFRKIHKLELQLVAIRSFSKDDPRKYGFDMALEFAPSTEFFKKAAFENNEFPLLNVEGKLIDINFEGTVLDYRKLALNDKLYPFFKFPTYKSVMPSWDNDARRKGKGMIFHNTSPDLYAHWLDKVLKLETKTRPDPLVFLNAWNEWAEGTVLEPTLHQGYSILRRTTETLAKYSQDAGSQKQWSPYGLPLKNPETKLAVIIHISGKEGWRELEKKLAVLEKIPHDLFITLTKKDSGLIKDIKAKHEKAVTFEVPNRGRNVLPFIFVAGRLAGLGYEYFLKLHTQKAADEKSEPNFNALLDNLLPSRKAAEEVLKELAAGQSVIGPAKHFASLENHFAENQEGLEKILEILYGHKKAGEFLGSARSYKFFAGAMFWCKLDALKPILDQHFLPEDFEAEKNQTSGTLESALEIAFSLVPQINGLKLAQISKDEITKTI